MYIDISNIFILCKNPPSELNDIRNWVSDCYTMIEDTCDFFDLEDDYGALKHYLATEIFNYYTRVEYRKLKPKIENIKELLKDISSYLTDNKDYIDDLEIEEIQNTIDEYSIKLDEKTEILEILETVLFGPKRGLEKPKKKGRVQDLNDKSIPNGEKRIPNKSKRIPTNDRYTLEARKRVANLRRQYNTI